MRKILVRLLLGTLALAIACVTVACSPLGTTGPISGPYPKSIYGPDVSNYQHPYGSPINWSAVRATGARFAFVKVSEGNFYTNPYASSDIAGARAAGLYVGAYHFGRPRLPLSTAASDANLFAWQVGNVKVAGYLPPVLDIEVTDGLSAANVTAWTRLFLSTLQADTGRAPIIYTGGWFWRGYMGNPTGFSQYPLWAAEYIPQQTGPDLFGDFSHSTFWQYSDSARISGINGAVDASWFHGTQAQLDSLAYVLSSTNLSMSRGTLNTLTQHASPGADAKTAGPAGSRMAQDPSLVSGH